MDPTVQNGQGAKWTLRRVQMDRVHLGCTLSSLRNGYKSYNCTYKNETARTIVRFVRTQRKVKMYPETGQIQIFPDFSCLCFCRSRRKRSIKNRVFLNAIFNASFAPRSTKSKTGKIREYLDLTSLRVHFNFPLCPYKRKILRKNSWKEYKKVQKFVQFCLQYIHVFKVSHTQDLM